MITGVMIVKNEEHIIERCLRSAAKVVDNFVIVDTGSTDNTFQKIDAIQQELNLDLIVYQRPWVNFGHNRTEALKLAKDKGDYALIIDADDELIGTIPTELDADAHAVNVISGSTTFHQTRILNLKIPWRYVGSIHEYPTCSNTKKWTFLPDLTIKTSNDGSSWKNPNKYKEHALILWKDHIEDPTNPRIVFYMAQSFKGCNDFEEAERWYKKRITMGGWIGEIWYSKYYLGLLEKSRGNQEQAITWLLDAYETDIRRAEPLYQLLKIHRHRGQNNIAFIYGQLAMDKEIPDDALFPIPSHYTTDLFDELAMCAYKLDKKDFALELWNRMLEYDLSDKTRQRIEQNIKSVNK